MFLLALEMGGYSVVQLAIFIVVALAVCAIVYYSAEAMGIPIPPFLVKIIGIVVIAVIAILAIKFVAGV